MEDVEFTRLVKQVEEGQHSYVENLRLLKGFNGMIAKRRAREQEFEREQDEGESGYEEYEGEQSIRMIPGHLGTH